MGKRLYIDLVRLRGMKARDIEAIDSPEIRGGFKTLRELATFRYTCRHCRNAPCIEACPADALEKDSAGIIHRSVNLCIRCRSCIMACPFGTMMSDLFQTRTGGYRYFDIADEDQMEDFARHYPSDVVRVVENGDELGENIHELNDRVMVRDLTWPGVKTEKK
jgi:Fe-S-cluster-containing dehydrogenase component